jgi:hypothetical protein
MGNTIEAGLETTTPLELTLVWSVTDILEFSVY